MSFFAVVVVVVVVVVIVFASPSSNTTTVGPTSTSGHGARLDGRDATPGPKRLGNRRRGATQQ